MNLQEYIEEALQDILQARTYITTNSITVARHVERESTDKGNQFVSIQADGEERLSNNHDLYFVECGIEAVTKIQEDAVGSDLDALWADVSDAITQDLTAATLQTAIDAINAASGITIAGLDYMPAEIETLDQYESREQRIKIPLIFTN
jgi:hypothetical protein